MRHTVVATLLLAAIAPLGAQQSSAPATDHQIFRASSTLATIDVVAVDDDGRHLTDLTKDDFQVVVGSRRQELQQAVYVRAKAQQLGTGKPALVAAGETGATTTPSAILKRAGIRPDRITRTLAFVVDDLNLSFESTYYVREALTRYVDTQMAPGDLVAIVRTASGTGALQEFTSDKRLLRLAIDRVRWDFRSTHAVSSFEATVNQLSADVPGRGRRELSREHPEEALRVTMAGMGTFGAVQYVARGIQSLPGRKSVILVSEGFPGLFRDRYEGGRLWTSLTRMLETVNRAGIVVYTVDPRGLLTRGATVEDVSDPNLLQDAATRRELVSNSQESLRFIATQTGGMAIADTNDLGRGIARILEDQQDYYLLGYVPSGSSPASWSHDGVRVTVDRPHVHVRARQGVFGPAHQDDERQEKVDSLFAAALSPFTSGDISARLTSAFRYDGHASTVRSLLFIDANDLQFTNSASGRETANLEVGIVASDETGVVGQLKRSVAIALDDAQYADARAHGLVYRVNLGVSRPGAYQIRAAVRDAATELVGSSSQFLEVPAVGKGKLAVSGVLLKGVDPEPLAATDESGLAVAGMAADALRQPTVRILPPGSKAIYAYEIYDGLSTGSELQTSTTLIRNGTPVYSSQPTPVQHTTADMGVSVVKIGGSLDLGLDVPEGPYSLRVDVARVRNGKLGHRVSQWVDFEVAAVAAH